MMSPYLYLILYTAIMLYSSNMMFLSSISILNWENIIMLILCLWIMMSLYIMNYTSMSENEFKTNKYLMNLMIISCGLIFIMENLVQFLILMELSVVFIMLTMMTMSKSKDKMYSMMVMLFMNVSGSIPFMYMIYIFKEFMSSSVMKFTSVDNMNNQMIMIFMMYLFLMKTPMFLMHYWLMKAHVSASGKISIVLASIMLKMGTYGMIKFYNMIMEKLTEMFMWANNFILVTNFLLLINMFRLYDLKVFVAYSSILHMSVTIPMLMIYSNQMIWSSVIMSLTHGLTSTMMFMFVTLAYEKMNNRSIQFNKSMETLSKNVMMMTFLMIIMNVGVPPILNFYSEIIYIQMILKLTLNLSLMLYLNLSIIIIVSFYVALKMMKGKKLFNIKNYSNLSYLYANTMLMIILMVFPLIM